MITSYLSEQQVEPKTYVMYLTKVINSLSSLELNTDSPTSNLQAIWTAEDFTWSKTGLFVVRIYVNTDFFRSIILFGEHKGIREELCPEIWNMNDHGLHFKIVGTCYKSVHFQVIPKIWMAWKPFLPFDGKMIGGSRKKYAHSTFTIHRYVPILKVEKRNLGQYIFGTPNASTPYPHEGKFHPNNWTFTAHPPELKFYFSKFSIQNSKFQGPKNPL